MYGCIVLLIAQNAQFSTLLHSSTTCTTCKGVPRIQDFLLKYLGATAAVVLIIGPFFGNHLRPVDNVLGRAHMLSTMRYHTSVVIYLFAALGTLGSSSNKLMKLSAYADRIADMQNTVTGLASSAGGELPLLFAVSLARVVPHLQNLPEITSLCVIAFLHGV